MTSQKTIQWSAALAGISMMASAGLASASDRFESWDEMEATGCYEEGSEYSGSFDYEIKAIENDPVCTGGVCYGEVYDPNLVIAIHGGEVEKWTDTLASEVGSLFPAWAGGGLIRKAGVYALDVHVQPGTCNPQNGGSSFTKDDSDLHITGTDYDEPQALQMVADAYSIVSIHGLLNSSYGDSNKNVVCVGGQNQEMRDDFISMVNSEPLLNGLLQAEDATLPSCVIDDTVPCTHCPDDATGTASSNIVNLGPNPNGGLQLEFVYKARQDLYQEDNYESRRELVRIIQDVMFLETTGLQ